MCTPMSVKVRWRLAGNAKSKEHAANAAGGHVRYSSTNSWRLFQHIFKHGIYLVDLILYLLPGLSNGCPLDRPTLHGELHWTRGPWWSKHL